MLFRGRGGGGEGGGGTFLSMNGPSVKPFSLILPEVNWALSLTQKNSFAIDQNASWQTGIAKIVLQLILNGRLINLY